MAHTVCFRVRDTTSSPTQPCNTASQCRPEPRLTRSALQYFYSMTNGDECCPAESVLSAYCQEQGTRIFLDATTWSQAAECPHAHSLDTCWADESTHPRGSQNPLRQHVTAGLLRSSLRVHHVSRRHTTRSGHLPLQWVGLRECESSPARQQAPVPASPVGRRSRRSPGRTPTPGTCRSKSHRTPAHHIACVLTYTLCTRWRVQSVSRGAAAWNLLT